MNLPFLAFTRHRAPVWLLMAGLVFPVAARATGNGDQDVGPHLLQARLPAGLSVQQADCDHLVRAVRAATLAHHQSAESILSAALAPEDGNGRPAAKTQRACPCVARIFRAAVNAAPDHARALLETAEALCPDCVDRLTEALQTLSDKNVVADPRLGRTDPAGPNDPDTIGNEGSTGSTGNAGNAGSAGTTGDPGSSSDPDDPNSFGYRGLSQRDFQGLDVPTAGTGNATDTGASVNGFGVGLGVGFPGSPGSTGSATGGGYALPLPTATTSTSSTNR